MYQHQTTRQELCLQNKTLRADDFMTAGNLKVKTTHDAHYRGISSVGYSPFVSMVNPLGDLPPKAFFELSMQ